jgi:hypothetical protein
LEELQHNLQLANEKIRVAKDAQQAQRTSQKKANKGRNGKAVKDATKEVAAAERALASAQAEQTLLLPQSAVMYVTVGGRERQRRYFSDLAVEEGDNPGSSCSEDRSDEELSSSSNDEDADDESPQPHKVWCLPAPCLFPW